MQIFNYLLQLQMNETEFNYSLLKESDGEYKFPASCYPSYNLSSVINNRTFRRRTRREAAARPLSCTRPFLQTFISLANLWF